MGMFSMAGFGLVSVMLQVNAVKVDVLVGPVLSLFSVLEGDVLGMSCRVVSCREEEEMCPG